VNDATYEAQKARIMALHKKWAHPLGFGTWGVTYEWYREHLPPRDGALDEGKTVLFRITTEWEYLRLLIKVNLAEVQHLDDHDLETHLLHEFGHAFLSIVLCTPIGEDGDATARRRSVEHVCTWLGKAFRWVRVAGEGDQKKKRKARKKAKRAQAKEHAK